jgi:hypothetical protein
VPIPNPMIDTAAFNPNLAAGSTINPPLTNVLAGTSYQVQFLNLDGTPVGGCGATGTATVTCPPAPDYTGIAVTVPSTAGNYYLEVGLATVIPGQEQQRHRVPVTVVASAPVVGVTVSITPPSGSAHPVNGTFTVTPSGGDGNYTIRAEAYNAAGGGPLLTSSTIMPTGQTVITHQSTNAESYTLVVTAADGSGNVTTVCIPYTVV